ncbi:hypothetical protein JW758_05360 [Candidatus Peregrinibacteria bacterium]|nr:hypothetical protein [Candidatus Peregrinibacteria bacterium]
MPTNPNDPFGVKEIVVTSGNDGLQRLSRTKASNFLKLKRAVLQDSRTRIFQLSNGSILHMYERPDGGIFVVECRSNSSNGDALHFILPNKVEESRRTGILSLLNGHGGYTEIK